MIPCLRTAATIFIVLILSTLDSVGAQDSASAKAVPIVTIDSFLSGVRIPQEKGYEIIYFRLGDHRVTALFDTITVDQSDDQRHPSDTNTLLVKVRNREALAELREKSFLSKELRIDVLMGKNTWSCRSFGGLLASPQCSTRIAIPFTIDYATPCEEVTRVIYVALGEEMKGVRLEGDSPTPIPLDHLFSLLLANKVEPFIKNHLDPIDSNNNCFEEFGLLKWLRNEKIEGFNRSDYVLHQGLRDVLSGIGGTLAGMKWERYHFDIELIGYADQSVFRGARSLSQKDTGIGGWDQIRRPLAIYYSGCKGDRLLKKNPSSIAFGKESKMPVGSEINDNCELGATRAYVATVFLANLLGTSNIEYKYGTGGIIETSDRSKDYLNRRIEIRIVAKSAARSPRVRDIPLVIPAPPLNH